MGSTSEGRRRTIARVAESGVGSTSRRMTREGTPGSSQLETSPPGGVPAGPPSPIDTQSVSTVASGPPSGGCDSRRTSAWRRAQTWRHPMTSVVTTSWSPYVTLPRMWSSTSRTSQCTDLVGVPFTRETGRFAVEPGDVLGEAQVAGRAQVPARVRLVEADPVLCLEPSRDRHAPSVGTIRRYPDPVASRRA